MPSRLLKNHFDTGATQHSRRTGTASEQPAGWSKPVLSFAEGRPSSEAVASEEAKAYSVRYVEPPSAARTKLADFFNILLGLLWNPAALEPTPPKSLQLRRSGRRGFLRVTWCQGQGYSPHKRWRFGQALDFYVIISLWFWCLTHRVNHGHEKRI